MFRREPGTLCPACWEHFCIPGLPTLWWSTGAGGLTGYSVTLPAYAAGPACVAAITIPAAKPIPIIVVIPMMGSLFLIAGDAGGDGWLGSIP